MSRQITETDLENLTSEELGALATLALAWNSSRHSCRAASFFESWEAVLSLNTVVLPLSNRWPLSMKAGSEGYPEMENSLIGEIQ